MLMRHAAAIFAVFAFAAPPAYAKPCAEHPAAVVAPRRRRRGDAARADCYAVR